MRTGMQNLLCWSLEVQGFLCRIEIGGLDGYTRKGLVKWKIRGIVAASLREEVSEFVRG